MRTVYFCKNTDFLSNHMGNSSTKKEGSILMCGKTLCSLSAVTRRCYEKQMAVARSLRELATDLERQQGDMYKAKVGLAAVGITVAGASFGLSFVTFGASLVLTIVGASVAAASGVGSVATSIAEKVIQTKRIKEANDAILAYSNAVMEFAPVLEHFCDRLSSQEEKLRMRSILTDSSIPSSSVRFAGIKNDGKLCETCAKGHRIVSTALRVQEALSLTPIGDLSSENGPQVARWSLRMVTEFSSFGKEAFTSLNSAARVIQIGGATLFGVGLIVDVGTIVYYSIKIHKKQPSEVAEVFRVIAQAFDEEQ